jgi:acetyl esterase/lipase
MKKIYLLGLFAAGAFALQAQQDCSNGRYVNEVFPTITTTSDIQYGANLDLSGNNVNLLLDVYQPAGDTETNRPIVIFIHGGSFVGGSKTGTDVVPLAQEFAKKGYVTASINYRLGMNGIPFPGPGEKDATETVMRATQDTRAAVRFFRKSVDTEGNPYGIDDTQIFLVGVSAGGFNALHLAYLDEESEIPAAADLNEPGLGGGVEGESGSPGYSSEVTAIVNIAGALGDVNWMKAGDTPVLSLHGDADNTVPYGTAMIQLLGIYNIMVVDGSSSVHARAEDLGLLNCFKPHPGAGHVPHTSNANYYDTTATYMTQWLKTFVCGGTDYCYDYATMSLEENVLHTVNVYPNPATTKLTIESEGTLNSVRIVDFSGRIVKTVANMNTTILNLDVSALPEGIYFVESLFNNGSRTISKVVIR